MPSHVEIAFECLPFRSITRWNVPCDASPEVQARCRRIQALAAKHGLHNSYYLGDGRAVFHLTNDANVGMLAFRFDGAMLTDAQDRKTLGADLAIDLDQETCDWLVAPVVEWFRETVRHAVIVEFDRYIAAGDPARTRERLERLEMQLLAGKAFVGMGL
ncbi:MAG: hypothetical protein ABFD16_15590 [Thermoguttaceae bacterium]|jgi:hypothetical protein